jgi:hypothetical protein
MTFTDKRQQVMLTEGIQLDILHQDHLVVVGFENGVINHLVDSLPVTARQVLHGLGGTLRCL